MTVHNINANLTAIITEAWSNVGNFSKIGGNKRKGICTQMPKKASYAVR
jgi:hypothetical protein